MRLNMLGFSSGVIILYCSDSLLVSTALILAGLCSLFYLKGKRRFFVLSFLLGLMLSAFSVVKQSSGILLQSDVGKVHKFRGYFCSLPKNYERFIQADFCLHTESDRRVMKKIRLSWSKTLKSELPTGIVDLTARLKLPKSTHNFVGFSYEKYLFYKGIHARGKVMSFDVIKDTQSVDLPLDNYFSIKIHQWRYEFVQYIETLLDQTNHQGIMKALITGDTSSLSDRDALILKDTGTQHLVAISGLHVGLLVLVLIRIFPRSVGSYFLLIVLSFAYIVLVGFSESAQRAWVMSALAVLMLSGKFSISRANVFLMALSMVLLIDPLAPLNAGFWYSFVAVAVILLFSGGVSGRDMKPRSLMAELVFMQIVLSLGLLVVNTCFGAAAGVSSLLANLFAVPWVTLLVLPALLIATFLSLLDKEIAQGIFELIDMVVQIMMEYLASLVLLEYHFNYLSDSLMIVCYIAVFCFLVFFRVAGNYFALFLFILLVFIVVPIRTEEKREFIVFDAGQGLAIAMIWDEQYWLYDVGLAQGSFSVADSVIKPYLKQAGLHHRDSGLIISHGDADHSGSWARMSDFSQPHTIWMGEPERLGQHNDLSCVRGDLWTSGDGKLSVLYPFDQEKLHNAASDKQVKNHRWSFQNNKTWLTANNRSCVVRFELDGVVFLLMGDVEGLAEKQLIERYKEQLKADVLIAGHHGSNNATRLSLLKYVRPEYVVFASGYQNSFGHPHKEVIRRSELMGAKVINTSKTGAVKFLLSDDQINLLYARIERQAPWFLSF